MKLPAIPWLVLLILIGISATATRAEIPRIDLKQDTLQAVLDRIHDHAANDAWKQGGFKDDAIEKWLERLVGSVAKAAEFPELKLPVRLTDVKPPPPENPAGKPRGRSLSGALIVAKDADLKTAMLRDSVILADGAVEVE